MEKDSYIRIESIGTFEFGDIIDVTDPCLERDNVNRFKDVRILPGVYYCEAAYDNDKIQEITIRHKPSFDKFVGECPYDIIGGVGVFSGVAGFFHSDMEKTEEEWYAFCDTIKNNQAWITQNGFCASQEVMEKGFPVFAHKNENGEIDSLSIVFFLPEFTE